LIAPAEVKTQTKDLGNKLN